MTHMLLHHHVVEQQTRLDRFAKAEQNTKQARNDTFSNQLTVEAALEPQGREAFVDSDPISSARMLLRPVLQLSASLKAKTTNTSKATVSDECSGTQQGCAVACFH
jgi:hypothetical protein